MITKALITPVIKTGDAESGGPKQLRRAAHSFVEGSAEHSMDRETFKNWLSSYGNAWARRDPDVAASLYTDDATYQVTPFERPLRGRAAIYDYWVGVAKAEQKVHFDFEIIAMTSELGIAKWWASFLRIPQGMETKLDGIFLISLDSEGRCQSLREWWHKATAVDVYFHLLRSCESVPAPFCFWPSRCSEWRRQTAISSVL